MRILIIGAGSTGGSLAMTLSAMNHDLVLVDKDESALRELEAELDVMSVVGSGSSPLVLEETGLAKTDIVLAVTSQDEVNILACLYAQQAGVKTKVARVRDTDYLASSRWDWRKQGIDLLVSQHEESAREIKEILRFPGAVDIADMLDGRIFAVGVRLNQGSPLVRKKLERLAEDHEILSRSRFIGVMRNQKLLVPSGDTLLREDDEAFVVLHAQDVDVFLNWAHHPRPRFSRHIIAGGGGTGLTLAAMLEQGGDKTVLIERDIDRAEFVAEHLSKTLVLRGDTSKQDTLQEAGIGKDCAFIAMTGDDELNIVSCIQAKKMGAPWTVAQVGKPEYAPIIRHMRLLDRVISPYTIMINAILRFVRGQNVRAATLFQSLPGELLEMELEDGNKWCGKELRRVPWPKGAIVALVQRGEQLFIPAGDFVLRAGDHLAVFADHKSADQVPAALKK